MHFFQMEFVMGKNQTHIFIDHDGSRWIVMDHDGSQHNGLGTRKIGFSGTRTQLARKKTHEIK